jgi:hypothetical protein
MHLTSPSLPQCCRTAPRRRRPPKDPSAMQHCRPSKLCAPHQCRAVWVGPCLYHLARRLRPSPPVPHPETSSPPIHRQATIGHTTTRAMRVVTTHRACTTASAGTGRAGRCRTWAVTPSLGLRPKSAHYYSLVFSFFPGFFSV